MAVPLSRLGPKLCLLAQSAVAAAAHSYAPYSRFTVGAALLHEDDAITIGANVENCVYQSCCAERAAIVAANAKGYRRAMAVAVFGRPKDYIAGPRDAQNVCTPCGVCRQLLYELRCLSGRSLPIVLVTTDGLHAETTSIDDLLPRPFGPQDVGIDVAQWNTGTSERPTTTRTSSKITAVRKGGASSKREPNAQKAPAASCGLKKRSTARAAK